MMLRTAVRPAADSRAGERAAPASPTTGEGAAAPRVLLLATGLNVGGAERVVLDLAQGYREAGVPVTVMGLAKDRALLERVDTRGLDIRILGMRKSATGFARAVRDLVTLIRRERISVVHAHMPHAAFVAAAARPFARFALVHTSHNFEFSRHLALALRWTRGLRDVDILLAPGQHAALNSARTELIPNGIRLPGAPTPRPTGAEPPLTRLMAVCRLTEQKNPIALIDAMAALRRDPRHAGVRLRIAGDGPLRPDVEARIATLGLEASVELLGVRADVETLLADADVFVMSSRYEGLPLAVLEAGAAGLPVVAPPVGGLPWVLGDDCGFLAEPAALADVLGRVLNDPAEARRRAENLRRRVEERFSQQRCVDAHLALYRRLVASGAD